MSSQDFFGFFFGLKRREENAAPELHAEAGVRAAGPAGFTCSVRARYSRIHTRCLVPTCSAPTIFEHHTRANECPTCSLPPVPGTSQNSAPCRISAKTWMNCRLLEELKAIDEYDRHLKSRERGRACPVGGWYRLTGRTGQQQQLSSRAMRFSQQRQRESTPGQA